ncbi:MAG: hypothetical protein ACRDZO_23580 [Egibacteraceae bacterium]
MNIRNTLVSVALAAVSAGAPLLTGSGTAFAATQPSCVWRYVVTDGVFNDVLIYDDVSSATVVGRIHPGEEFRTPRPPRLVAGSQGVRLEIRGGWVGYGNYTVLQSSSAACARITLNIEER